MKRVMLALLGGVLAGAAMGLLVWSGDKGKGPAGQLRTLRATARRALDEGRRRLRRASTSPSAGGPPVPAPFPGGRPLPLPAGARDTLRSWWEALRARWREAVAEGRRASAETQRDLRRRYERLTGRLR